MRSDEDGVKRNNVFLYLKTDASVLLPIPLMRQLDCFYCCLPQQCLPWVECIKGDRLQINDSCLFVFVWPPFSLQVFAMSKGCSVGFLWCRSFWRIKISFRKRALTRLFVDSKSISNLVLRNERLLSVPDVFIFFFGEIIPKFNFCWSNVRALAWFVFWGEF